MLLVDHAAQHIIGDYQFDVYRMMKHLTKGVWEEFHPTTNILVNMSAYLSDVILRC